MRTWRTNKLLWFTLVRYMLLAYPEKKFWLCLWSVQWVGKTGASWVQGQVDKIDFLNRVFELVTCYRRSLLRYLSLFITAIVILYRRSTQILDFRNRLLSFLDLPRSPQRRRRKRVTNNKSSTHSGCIIKIITFILYNTVALGAAVEIRPADDDDDRS